MPAAENGGAPERPALIATMAPPHTRQKKARRATVRRSIVAGAARLSRRPIIRSSALGPTGAFRVEALKSFGRAVRAGLPQHRATVTCTGWGVKAGGRGPPEQR